MKKFLFILIISALLLPGLIFAQTIPIETEVQLTMGATLSTFGVVFISSMFGQAPEGVSSETDDAGNSILNFENFNPSDFFKAMAEMTGESSSPNDGELPFKTMTGTVSADSDGNMSIDMQYMGGNVKTLKLQTSGEDVLILTANGKDYSYIENILNTD